MRSCPLGDSQEVVPVRIETLDPRLRLVRGPPPSWSGLRLRFVLCGRLRKGGLPMLPRRSSPGLACLKRGLPHVAHAPGGQEAPRPLWRGRSSCRPCPGGARGPPGRFEEGAILMSPMPRKGARASLGGAQLPQPRPTLGPPTQGVSRFAGCLCTVHPPIRGPRLHGCTVHSFA